MTNPITITAFEIENIKRVSAVALQPAATGLTIIGGDNRQGKSSVIDAIAFALGGESFTPSAALHDGADKGRASVTLSNGIVATRSVTAKGSYLKVTDPTGKAAGQTLLNEFVHGFALDLSQFIEADDRKKATILLQIIGVDLAPLNERRKTLYDQRLAVGRLKDRQQHHAEAMPYIQDLPAAPVTATEIMAQLQDVVTHNAQVRELIAKAQYTARDAANAAERVRAAEERVEAARATVAEAQLALEDARATAETFEANKKAAAEAARAAAPRDDSDLKAKLAEVEELNKKINQNLDRTKAFDEAEAHSEEYRELSAQIEAIELQKADLLAAAKMPLDGLTIQEDALCYKGKAWDCMSHAEQLIAATAVVRNLNPAQGFVLIDKVEAMDLKTLAEFGKYLTDTGLQAITTRVSRGEECTIIVEEGVISSFAEPKF